MYIIGMQAYIDGFIGELYLSSMRQMLEKVRGKGGEVGEVETNEDLKKAEEALRVWKSHMDNYFSSQFSTAGLNKQGEKKQGKDEAPQSPQHQQQQHKVSGDKQEGIIKKSQSKPTQLEQKQKQKSPLFAPNIFGSEPQLKDKMASTISTTFSSNLSGGSPSQQSSLFGSTCLFSGPEEFPLLQIQLPPPKKPQAFGTIVPVDGFNGLKPTTMMNKSLFSEVPSDREEGSLFRGTGSSVFDARNVSVPIDSNASKNPLLGERSLGNLFGGGGGLFGGESSSVLEKKECLLTEQPKPVLPSSTPRVPASAFTPCVIFPIEQNQTQDKQVSKNLTLNQAPKTLMNAYQYSEDSQLSNEQDSDRPDSTNLSQCSEDQLKPQQDTVSVFHTIHDRSLISQPPALSSLSFHHHTIGKFLISHLTPANIQSYRSTISDYMPSNYFHVGPRYSMLGFFSSLANKIQKPPKWGGEYFDGDLVGLGEKVMGYWTEEKMASMRQISSQYNSSNYFHVGPRRTMFAYMEGIMRIVEKEGEMV